MSTELLSIMRHLLKMLGDQGYSTTHMDPILQMTPEALDFYIDTSRQKPDPVQAFFLLNKFTSSRSMLSSIYEKKGNPNDRIFVYFVASTEKKISIDELRFFARFFIPPQNFRPTSGILISGKNASAMVSQKLDEAKGLEKFFVRIFQDEELLYDPTVSVWVPQSRLLAPSEVGRLVKGDEIDPRQMPREITNDPIAKRLGARPGQIIEETYRTFLPEQLVDIEVFYRSAYNLPPEKRK